MSEHSDERVKAERGAAAVPRAADGKSADMPRAAEPAAVKSSHGRHPAPAQLGGLDDRFGPAGSGDGGSRSTAKRKSSPVHAGEAKRRLPGALDDIDARFGGDGDARPRAPAARSYDSRDARHGGREERERDHRERDHRERERERRGERERERERERPSRDAATAGGAGGGRSSGGGGGSGGASNGTGSAAATWKRDRVRGPRYVGTQEQVRQHHSSIDERFDDERFEHQPAPPVSEKAPRTPAHPADGTTTPAAAGTPRKVDAQPLASACASEPVAAAAGDGAESSAAALEVVRAELAEARRHLAERARCLETSQASLVSAHSQIAQLNAEAAARAAAPPAELAVAASAAAEGASGSPRAVGGASATDAPPAGAANASAREAELMNQVKERDAKLQTLREAHKASLAEKTKRMQELRAELAEKESRLTALRESHKLSLTEWCALRARGGARVAGTPREARARAIVRARALLRARNAVRRSARPRRRVLDAVRAPRRRNKNKLSLIAELSEKQTLLSEIKGAFKEQQKELQALKTAAGASASAGGGAAAAAAAPGKAAVSAP